MRGSEEKGTQMRILLARHGEMDWNAAKKVQGATDIPLKENGVRQTGFCTKILKRTIKSSVESTAAAKEGR